MKIFSTVLNFLPPWVPFAVMGALLVAVGGAVWAWGNAREEAGTAKMSAAINAASLKTIAEQLDRNQAIADAVDSLTSQRAETIRETIREVHIQPATTVCRDTPAMRVLNGQLQSYTNARTFLCTNCVWEVRVGNQGGRINAWY